MRRQWHKRLLALLASCIISTSTVVGQTTSGEIKQPDDHFSTPTTSTRFLIESPDSPIYTQVLKQGMYIDIRMQPRYLDDRFYWLYLHFSYFLFILGILTYKWQVDFNNDQINVEVTFKKTADKNQNSQSTTSGNVDRPIDGMIYYLSDISFIISWLFLYLGVLIYGCKIYSFCFAQTGSRLDFQIMVNLIMQTFAFSGLIGREKPIFR